ncbi:DUF6153 family protein [Streptomyces sp. NPDC058734]|uniref:DUF6153 family protein n=1 Tax=Streptomyces sp. NPDC058734 TaxID=3346615 RepID=UPI00368DC976
MVMAVITAMRGMSMAAIVPADLVLMRSDPLDVPTALRIGRDTLRKMRQNLGRAIGSNTVALPVAAGGFEPATGLILRPEIAALSMSGSTVIVAVNVLALKRLRLPGSTPEVSGGGDDGHGGQPCRGSAAPRAGASHGGKRDPSRAPHAAVVRPVPRLGPLLVLALIIGLLGMHGLGTAAALPATGVTVHVSHHAAVDPLHPRGADQHHDLVRDAGQADQMCASPALPGAPGIAAPDTAPLSGMPGSLVLAQPAQSTQWPTSPPEGGHRPRSPISRSCGRRDSSRGTRPSTSATESQPLPHPNHWSSAT